MHHLIKKCQLLTLVICTLLIFSTVAFYSPIGAKEYSTEPITTDIIFVLDVSGSMKSTDQGRISIEIIKLMMDLYSESNIRIGLLAYNDSIVAKYNLADMSNTSLRNDLKKQINAIPFSGYTDMGLALNKSLKMFNLKKNKNTHQPIIILLSDGETDLSGSESTRTNNDSYKDIKKSVSYAKKNNIPIYTIGLTNSFNLDLDYLTTISNSTNANSYAATNPYQLIDILNGILSPYTNTVISPTTTYTCSKSSNSIDLEPADNSIDTYNILLLNNDRCSLKDVLSSSKKVTIINSNTYTLIKIKKPSTKTIRLKFDKSDRTDTIDLTTLNSYNLTPTFTIDDSIYKNRNTTIHFSFKDNISGEFITDETLYQSLKVEYYIKESNSSELKKLEATNEGDEFSYTATFPRVGSYEVYATYKGDFLTGITNSFSFDVINNPPSVVSKIQDTIVKQEGTKTYNLDTLFSDQDNDHLNYQIVSSTGASLDTTIDQNTLHIKGLSYGSSTLVISASDEQGDSCTTTVELNCISIFTKYKLELTLAIIGFITVIIIIIEFIIIRHIKKKISMPKPEFVGYLVGYFMRTKSDDEIPPLKWILSEYPNKTIPLSHLLKDRSIDLVLPDTSKIWIVPKVGNTIELIHNTHCTILVGTQVINRNTPTIIRFNDKIYIAFEDLATELELRFKNPH